MDQKETLYTADIGSWERGRNVDLPGAFDIKSALDQANSILAVSEFDPPIESAYVVQIKRNKKIVWDYMNGTLLTKNGFYP